jgi:hypothetical protein
MARHSDWNDPERARIANGEAKNQLPISELHRLSREGLVTERAVADGYANQTAGNGPRERVTVTSVLEEMNGELHEFREAVEQLEQVLGPVLISVPPQPSRDNKEPETGVPVVDSLVRLLRMTRDIRMRVVSIGQRVSL